MSEADRERWDHRYREGGPALREPSRLIVALDDELPRRGRALDVAGGAGRHAIWLAQRGLDVTLVDVSQVALELCRGAAAAAGVTIATARADLEDESLPAGPWDLVLCFHFLLRPLLAAVPAALAPGGLLVFVQPTRSNLLRHERPGPTHLLDDGELPGLLGGLDLVRYDEGWLDEGRHEARVIARKPA